MGLALAVDCRDGLALHTGPDREDLPPRVCPMSAKKATGIRDVPSHPLVSAQAETQKATDLEGWIRAPRAQQASTTPAFIPKRAVRVRMRSDGLGTAAMAASAIDGLPEQSSADPRCVQGRARGAPRQRSGPNEMDLLSTRSEIGFDGFATNQQERRSVMNVIMVGLDLAKVHFHVVGLDEANHICLDRKLTRAKLHALAETLPQCIVAMEACASSHYWGRLFEAAGHEVRLLPAQYVKAFTRTQKNDRADARAIAEAASRPGLHFVPVKSVHQQALQGVMRLRDRLVKMRTRSIQTLRSLLMEFGLTMPKGAAGATTGFAKIREDADWLALPEIFRAELEQLHEEIQTASARLRQLEARLSRELATDPKAELLRSIPGIGPVNTGLLLAGVGDASQFASGRCLAAWLGLVPRQHSSGGKTRLGAITKRGNITLRTTLVHGARAVLGRIKRNREAPANAFEARWAAMLERHPFNRVCVAQANKMARIIHAVLRTGEKFRPELATA